MNSKPSSAYRAAVKEGHRHHMSSKTYSGSLLRPHKPFLTEMIARLGARSALDYGCGKGVQYRWIDPADGKTLEEAWGFDVAKYDPCWPPFSTEPAGPFDLVICTHTLALIPLGDLDWALAHIYGFARRGVFIAEKIGPRKKLEVDTKARERPIGWSANEWMAEIGIAADRYPHIETILSLRTREPEGAMMRRYRRQDRTRIPGRRWKLVPNPPMPGKES